MKIFISNKLSCDSNYDSQAIKDSITEKNIGEFTSDYSDADVIIFADTCCGCMEYIEYVIRYMKHVLNNKKDSAITIVSGCITRKFKNLKLSNAITNFLKSNFDYIIDELNYENIINIITNEKMIEKPEIGYATGIDNWADLYITTGCNNACSFCKTTYQNIQLKSSLFKDLKELIITLPDEIDTVNLLGMNTAQYGIDLDESVNLTNVLELLENKDSIRNINIIGFSFSDAIKYRLSEKMKYISKINSLRGSVESGSDRILSLMNKGYDRKSLIKFYKELTSLYDVKLNTDIIACFPTETENDIIDTITLLEILNPNFIDVHVYNDSPMVASHRLNQLSEDEKSNNIKYYQKLLVKNNIRYELDF